LAIRLPLYTSRGITRKAAYGVVPTAQAGDAPSKLGIPLKAINIPVGAGQASERSSAGFMIVLRLRQ
jgi:hypothetical protein